MAELNKFGEISGNGVCPECGKPIKTEWIVCPYCRTKLSEETKVTVCPKCGKQVELSWKSCAYCAANLEKTKKTNKKKRKDATSNSEKHNRFVCPGCGEKATASDHSKLCKNCNAFVHQGCTTKGKCVKPFKEGRGFFGNSEDAKYEYLCPICETVLHIA